MGRATKNRKTLIANLSSNRDKKNDPERVIKESDSYKQISHQYTKHNTCNILHITEETTENTTSLGKIIIQGNFHQSNVERYQMSSGKQCVANSFVAIAFNAISNIERWTANTLDFILDTGNDLYVELSTNQTVKHDFLLISELPRRPYLFDKQFLVEISNEPQVGLIGTDVNTHLDHIMTLYEAIQMALIQHSACFITFGNNTFCVIKHSDYYFIFDSHSRNTSGLLIPNGRSVLIKTNNIMDIYTHCIDLSYSLNLPRLTQFEVTGINILLDSTIQSTLSTDTCKDVDVIVSKEEISQFEFIPLSNNQIKEKCSLLGLPFSSVHNSSKSKALSKPSKIGTIQGDGNCFFRAISYALTQSEDYHRRIRLSVVKHMRSKKELFTPLLRPGYLSIEDYILKSKMRLMNVWVTELEIFTTANLLNSNIYTYSNRQWLKFSPSQNMVVDVDTGIYLNHKNQDHYEVVLDVSDNDVGNYIDNVECEVIDPVLCERKQMKRKRGFKWSKSKKQNTNSNEKYMQYRMNMHDKYWDSNSNNRNGKKTLKKYNPEKRKECYKHQLHYSGLDKELLKEKYNDELKPKLKQKYSTELKFPLKQKYSTQLKFPLKQKYSTQLKFPLKQKYSTHLKFPLKQKYSTQLKFQLKQKYSTKLKRLHQLKSLKSSYKMNRNNITKRNYRTKANYRQSLINKSRQKYRTCEDQRNKVLSQNKQRKQNKTSMLSLIDNVIKQFRSDCSVGPIFICCVCEKLLFRNQVTNCNEEELYKKSQLIATVAKKCIRKTYLHNCNNDCIINCDVSDNMKSLWICFTCQRKILKGKLPQEAMVNNMTPDSIPEELKILNTIETHLIALHIPFIKLVKATPQQELKVSGPCTCVPNNINEVTNVLPRGEHDDKLIRIKLKRKLNYKSYHDYQTVTKRNIHNALEYLILNNKHYRDVSINDEWMAVSEDTAQVNNVETNYCMAESSNSSNQSGQLNITQEASALNQTDDEDDELPDIDPNISNNISDVSDTCLQPVDIAQHILDHNFDEIISISPAEQNKPVRILTDLTNEAKCFPSLFPTGKSVFSDEREERITLGRYLHCKLMNADMRFAQNSDYIFYSQFLFEINQIISSVSIALRQGKFGVSKISPDMLTQSEPLNDIIKLDQGYKFMKSIRGTPSYWQTAQKDLIAMVRQLGKPSWFASFSCGELRFEEILETILKQKGDNRKVSDLDWLGKRQLLRSNPVTVVRMFDYRFQLFLKNVIMSPANPIGKVIDYFWRYEVQQRGSLHTHCLFWVEDAPAVGVNTDTEVINFVDKYISCNLPSPKNDPELHEVIKNVQTHSSRHSKSCKKGKKECRFNFPRPPSKSTFISKPVEIDDENADASNAEDVMSIKKAKEILQNIHKFINDPNKSFVSTDDLFLQLGINQDIFELASNVVTKKSNIVLKRHVKDIWINQYNKDLLRAWNANLDLQYVFDSYACVIYIVSYISKAEKEMGLLLNQVHQESKRGNLDVKTSMRKLSSTYLNSREVSSHEAVLRITHLPMKKCSRKVVFIPTGEGNIRLTLPLKVLQQKAKEGTLSDNNIYMTNICDRYKARPLGGKFDDMCLATFCSEYRVMAKSENPNIYSDKNPAYELQHDLGFIIKRTRTSPAIVRYARFSSTSHPENYYLSRLQLFLPYRVDKQLKPEPFEFHEEFYRTGAVRFGNQLREVKAIVEENRKLYERDDFDASNVEEVLQSAINLEDAWANISPETELDRLEKENMQHELNKDEDDIDRDTEIPDLIESKTNNDRSKREACISSISKSEAIPLLRSLNKKQSEIFYKIRQFCLDKVHERKPEQILLFVTGGAGSGKSHLIKSIYYEASRILSQKQQNLDEITVLMCAPTGVSAFNINCSTIHSTFNITINAKFPPYQPLGQDNMNTLRVKYSNVELLIIDEISMVDVKLLSYISGRLNQIKGSDQLFGNISVICFGDFYQLPPVKSKSLYNDNGLVDIWNGFFKISHLTEIMRQTNVEFAEMLNRIRVHKKGEKLLEADMTMLRSCETGEETDALHICATNAQVQQHNDKMLMKKCPDYITIEAVDYVKDPRTGQMIKKDKPLKNADSPLTNILLLGLSCRVMLVVNLDTSAGLTNGSFGTVTFIKNDDQNKPKIIYVLFDNERVGANLDKVNLPQGVPLNSIPIEIYEDRIGYKCIRRQFPLKLSYATTVHKVQGLSLDKAVVNLHKIFQSGQAYVALSRLRTLDGLIIQNFNEKVIYCDNAVEEAINRMESFIDPIIPVNPNSTVIILHNIQGLTAHYEDIKNDPRFLKADYICLTETWINKQDVNQFSLPNFTYHNKSRWNSYDSSRFQSLKEKAHGGVGLYCKTYCDILDLGILNIEYLAFNIPFINYLIVIIYRPPDYTISVFLNELRVLLHRLYESDCRCIVMGDFNQNLLIGYSSIQQLFNEYKFTQQVLESTTEGGTLIDHVYINHLVDLNTIKTNIMPTYFSFHESIKLTFK